MTTTFSDLLDEITKAIVLRDDNNSGFKRALEYCKNWCSDHQAEVGVAEMALGAAVVAWGAHIRRSLN